MLLQKRTHDVPFFPCAWGIFGGHSEEKDRSPLDTARREITEELEGADLMVPTQLLLQTKIFSPLKRQVVPVILYVMELAVGLERLRLKRTNGCVESAGFALFIEEEIGSLRMTADVREGVSAFFEWRKRGEGA